MARPGETSPHAADEHKRRSGRTKGRRRVDAGTCGPGNLHLINGLYDSQRNGAPVTFRGKDILEAENPNAVGMTGLLGWGGLAQGLASCDLLVMLGTDFPHREFLPRRAKIVQVDRRAENLGRRVPITLDDSYGIRRSIGQCGRDGNGQHPRYRDHSLTVAEVHGPSAIAGLRVTSQSRTRKAFSRDG